MSYIKVLAIKTAYSKDDLLINFDKIIRLGNEYLVYADDEIEVRFPVKPRYGIRPIKSVASDEYDLTFVYFKYLEVENGQ